MPLIKYQCNDDLLQFGAIIWFYLKNIFKTCPNYKLSCQVHVHIRQANPPIVNINILAG